MNISKPCSAISIDGQEIEIFRCDADGGIVFNHDALLRHHPGHKFKSPVVLKDDELNSLVDLWVELNKGENKTNV